MLVSATILTVAVSVAVASWVSTIDGIRLFTLANGLLAELNLARAESIRRGERVVICAAASDDECSNSSGWSHGRIMFEDVNNNGRREIAEAVIRISPSAPPGWSIQGNTPVSRYVSYHPMGGTVMVNGAFQAGTITISRVTGQNTSSVEIVINSMGRPRSQRVELPSCR